MHNWMPKEVGAAKMKLDEAIMMLHTSIRRMKGTKGEFLVPQLERAIALARQAEEEL